MAIFWGGIFWFIAVLFSLPVILILAIWYSGEGFEAAKDLTVDSLFDLSLIHSYPLVEKTLFSPAFLGGISFLAVLIWLMLVLASIGFSNEDLGRLDTYTELFLTLPLSTRVLYAERVMESAVLNFMGWAGWSSFFGVLLFLWGYNWEAVVLLAFGLAFLFNLLTAVVQSVLEVGLRRGLPLSVLKNIQAVAFILVMGGGLLLLSIQSFGKSHYFLYDWMDRAWPVIRFSFPAITLHWLQNGLFMTGRSPFLFLIQVGGIFLGGWWLIEWASRKGLEAVQGTYQGIRGKKKNQKISLEKDDPAPFWKRNLFSGVVGKDITLMFRDKRLLTQVFLLPLFMCTIYVFFNPLYLKAVLHNAFYWGALVVGMGIYSIVFPIGHTLVYEQDALWLLYTVPRPIGRLLLEKIGVWVGIAWLFAFGLFGMGLFLHPFQWTQTGTLLFWIIVGIPVFGVVAGSIGILSSDPLATDPKDRIDPNALFGATLMGMAFLGIYFLKSPWLMLTATTLFGVLAYALWQKVVANSEYLLDPWARPKRTMDLVDALVALLIFFFLQTFSFAVIIKVLHETAAKEPSIVEGSMALAISYAGAGVITVLGVWFVLWRQGVWLGRYIRFFSGESWKKIGALVLTGTVLSSAFASGYLFILGHIPGLRGLPFFHAMGHLRHHLFYLWLCMVGCAPLFEEILFRGMVFQSLRQGHSFFISAVVSALVFSFLHPVGSVLPVFFLGLVLAWVYERAGYCLLASMMIHALYNAVALGIFPLVFSLIG